MMKMTWCRFNRDDEDAANQQNVQNVCKMYVCIMYLDAAVGTVFEIATSPLAIILHSRLIKNVFFQFLKILPKKKKNFKKIAKNDNFFRFSRKFVI